MLKKWIALFVSMMMLFACTANAEVMTAGGWTFKEDTAISPEAASAFEKAMDGFVGVAYEPVALLGTQIVAGTNYCFLCKGTTITAQPLSFYALVYVYQDLEGGACVLDIQELDLGISKEEKIASAEDGQNPTMNIIGDYQDVVSQRASMHIDCLNQNEAAVTIWWPNSADQTVIWTFTGVFDTEKMQIHYTDCTKEIVTFSNEDQETTEIEYENGTGDLYIRDDWNIVWSDDQENAGLDCIFSFVMIDVE